MYKSIDLCAGIGGVRRGFERTGHFINVLSAEVDEHAARTYQHLFGDNPRGDLTSQDFKCRVSDCAYDILLAGFPCQPFSSQGNLEGFNDPTKGTIFFHIKQIIKKTRPKVVFLENVQNIVSHDNKKTLRIIIDSLEKKLNYKVVGVSYDENGNLVYDKKSFVRNTKEFGLPQNRPRAYFIAFDRELYGELLNKIDDCLPCELCEKLKNSPYLNKTLNEILEPQVALKYYMSNTYLHTLEEHEERQKRTGNGFGYFILNGNGNNREYSNTILATGGSGKERNLVVQPMPPHTPEEELMLNKKGGLNNKNIRVMTPTEWGRLQGFIGYAFINPETGKDEFSFPPNVPESQQYKQFGNSVSISVIETLAEYIYEQINLMNESYEIILHNLARRDGYITRHSVGECLDVNPPRASYILRKMKEKGLIKLIGIGKSTKYTFVGKE